MENETANPPRPANKRRRRWPILLLFLLIFIAAYFAFYHSFLPATFEFPAAKTGLLYSLEHYEGDCDIQVIHEPRHWFRTTLKFMRGDDEILTLQTHHDAAFVTEDNVLYFAHFHGVSQGCTLAAYDLRSGETLWKNNLWALPFCSHSAYSNNVALELIPGAIKVTGHEAYGDYVEIVDRRFGVSVAHKIYKQGFE